LAELAEVMVRIVLNVLYGGEGQKVKEGRRAQMAVELER
jgi:hypothetical protein